MRARFVVLAQRNDAFAYIDEEENHIAVDNIKRFLTGNVFVIAFLYVSDVQAIEREQVL